MVVIAKVMDDQGRLVPLESCVSFNSAHFLKCSRVYLFDSYCIIL